MLTVFGSINMDFTFPVKSLPQAGETVLCPSYMANPGGKGCNQAVAAARAAGADSKIRFFATVGADQHGTALKGILPQRGLSADDLVTSQDRPTALAVIGVDEAGENQIIVASGANLDADAACVPDAALVPDTIVLMQAEVPESQNLKLIERAARAGARPALNLAPARPLSETALELLDLLIVNEVEFKQAIADQDLTRGAEAAAVLRLAQSHDLTVVLTLGKDGCIAATGNGEVWRARSLSVDAVDTTGAGDAFSGSLALALSEGQSLPDALRFASTCAALACRSHGAQEAVPNRDEIEQHLPACPAPEQLTLTSLTG
ncbi:MAG: ribokinase [Alphaproteobacteria bacterium]